MNIFVLESNSFSIKNIPWKGRFSTKYTVQICCSIWGFAVGTCHIRYVPLSGSRPYRSLSSVGERLPDGKTRWVPGERL